MTAHVLCLTSSGGIPIFVRKKGEGDVMTFSKVASLNGVHMFLKSQKIDLKDTETPDTCVVWKEFANCITLIAVASGTAKYVLERFLEAVFSAMILVAGMEEIKNLRNVERLKRDLRACNPIIDKLLECLDIGDRNSSKTDLIDMTSCILCPENYLLQTCLEMFMECLDSMYGCVIVRGLCAVATESWWDLDPIERKLLVMAVTSDTQSSARDLPVFLPNKSPNVAFRLVSVTLVNGVEVLGLCGPNPELTEVERLAVQCWRSHMEVLRTAEQSYPRNIPTGIIPDSGILAFLLVNYKIGKFVISRNSQQSKIRIAGSHRLDILRTFFYQAVENFLIPRLAGSSETEESTKNEENCFFWGKETYWCSEYHKCHALKENDYVLCTLYSSVVPTHTMRFITQKTLKTLLADKQRRFNAGTFIATKCQTIKTPPTENFLRQNDPVFSSEGPLAFSLNDKKLKEKNLVSSFEANSSNYGKLKRTFPKLGRKLLAQYFFTIDRRLLVPSIKSLRNIRKSPCCTASKFK